MIASTHLECGRGFFAAMKGLLNTAQAQSLRITLQIFEERLRHADAWLAGMEESGVLYHRASFLSPEHCTEARTAIAEALAALTVLAQTFALECTEENMVSYIRADMSTSWADLCDTRSVRLQRYGDGHPALAELLDPGIEHLAALALRISALMDTDLG